ILTMLVAAINRYGNVRKPSYILVLCGAILFVLSDSLIALNKFGFPFIFSSIAVMSTYIAAQYLIVAGILKQKDGEFV
ncbi:MAG: lysoplasmalogenase, partial [Bacteroidales bacterium]